MSIFGRASTSAIDFLTALVLIFVTLIAYTKNKDSKPEEIASMYISWDSGVDVDIDPYVRMPNGSVVFYRDKDLGSVYIDHDDLGNLYKGDTLNIEVVKFGAVDGTYYSSAHLFRDGSSTKEHSVIASVFGKDGRPVCSRTISLPSAGGREDPRRELGLFELTVKGDTITCKNTDVKLRALVWNS